MVYSLQLLDKSAHFGLLDLLHSLLLRGLFIPERLADLCLFILWLGTLLIDCFERLIFGYLALAWFTLELALKGRLRVVLHFRLIIVHRYRLERCEQVDDLVLL